MKAVTPLDVLPPLGWKGHLPFPSEQFHTWVFPEALGHDLAVVAAAATKKEAKKRSPAPQAGPPWFRVSFLTGGGGAQMARLSFHQHLFWAAGPTLYLLHREGRPLPPPHHPLSCHSSIIQLSTCPLHPFPASDGLKCFSIVCPYCHQ